jgi:hypothetical protein
MSLNSIGGAAYTRPLASPQSSGTSPLRDQGTARPNGTGIGAGIARTPAPSQPSALRAPTAAPGAASALPLDAPAGTDPELWSVLSSEERGFFAKSGAMGPLTYGRIMQQGAQPVPPAVRGGRLDIRA